MVHCGSVCCDMSGVVVQVLRVARLGAAVIATFAVCWAPYLASPSAAAAVLTR